MVLVIDPRLQLTMTLGGWEPIPNQSYWRHETGAAIDDGEILRMRSVEELKRLMYTRTMAARRDKVLLDVRAGR